MKRMLLLLVGCLLTSWSLAADYLTWLDPETGITWNYTASGRLGITNNTIYSGYGVPACRDISRSEIVIPAKVAGLPISSIMVGWGFWPAADSLLV